MAIPAKECGQMIEACKAANKKLSIGYRRHFEPHHHEMMRLGQQQVYGKEEGMDFLLHFPNGTRDDCKTSYNDKYNKLRAEAANGRFELDPAYEYKGLKGDTSKGKMEVENVPQQARQMDAFADCILNNKPTTVPGEMGLRDVLDAVGNR